jgi:hypothetical protein
MITNLVTSRIKLKMFIQTLHTSIELNFLNTRLCFVAIGYNIDKKSLHKSGLACCPLSVPTTTFYFYLHWLKFSIKPSEAKFSNIDTNFSSIDGKFQQHKSREI